MDGWDSFGWSLTIFPMVDIQEGIELSKSGMVCVCNYILVRRPDAYSFHLASVLYC